MPPQPICMIVSVFTASERRNARCFEVILFILRIIIFVAESLGKGGCKLFNSLSAVADGVFFVLAHFGEGLTVEVEPEEGIVAESALAARKAEDLALGLAFDDDRIGSVGKDAGNRADELCLAVRFALESFEQLFRALDSLRALDCTFRILFLEAPESTLIRRYKETRRRHPLTEPGKTVQAALREEIALLQPVRDRADYIINTQNLTLAQLHKKLCRLFTETGEAKLPINVVAFGYKYGIPIDADLVLDVRFLPNPYYIEELKGLSGLDQPVFDFVMQQPDTAEYIRLLTAFIDFQLPRFREEGKPALTVAVGCTGGRHRSISVARALTDHLLEHGQNARLICRDLERVNEQ